MRASDRWMHVHQQMFVTEQQVNSNAEMQASNLVPGTGSALKNLDLSDPAVLSEEFDPGSE